MYTITLDTGTTNTRVTLWNHSAPLFSVKRGVGVKDTAIDGHNNRLKQAIKEAIQEVLIYGKVSLNDIEEIIASGMITSNVGLIEIPHLIVPVSKETLRKNLVRKKFKEIVDKEILFVPGVRNNVHKVTDDNFELMDIMRGEEVETIGIINRMNVQGPALIILPGSHSKFVSINEKNEITGCVTSLAGELISVITNNTIISNALQGSFAETLDTEFLIKGYESSINLGINRSAFSIRILDQFTDTTINQKANFLLGAVIASDLHAIRNSHTLNVTPSSKVIIGGKKVMKDAFFSLFEYEQFFYTINKVDDVLAENLAGYGTISLIQ